MERKVSPEDLSAQELLSNAQKFGEAVKHLRIAANWNQDYLAERIGVTRQTISSIENGTAKPSKTIGIALSAIFKEYQASSDASALFQTIANSTGFSTASRGLLGGALGWALSGPIGAIVGATAAVVKNAKKDSK
jgi:putative transcriptional regulator